MNVVQVRSLGMAQASDPVMVTVQRPALGRRVVGAAVGQRNHHWFDDCRAFPALAGKRAFVYADIVKTLNAPEVKERLAQNSIEATPSTPEQFAAHIKSETAKWAKVVKDSGVAVE